MDPQMIILSQHRPRRLGCLRAGSHQWGLHSTTFTGDPTTILCNPDGLVSNAQSAEYSRCVKGQQLLAMSDGQGFVSMIDTAEPLPCGVDFTEGQGNDLKAQWRAHELAITDLHWIKVSCGAAMPVFFACWCLSLRAAVRAGGHADDHRLC